MDDLSARALAAKDNEAEFHRLATENQRFIKRCAFRACHHFIRESDDEWSVSLIAFYEAVRSYDEGKGSFKGFASIVIKRRLMDFFDSMSRHSAELSADPYVFDGQLDTEDASAFDLEVAKKSAESLSQSVPGTSSLFDEVDAITSVIGAYGFDLHDIGGCSPKAAKTKKACAKVIEAIIASEEMLKMMRRKRNLPYARLLEIEGVTKKLLERHRKYLIAAVEIRAGDFPQLQEYIVRL